MMTAGERVLDNFPKPTQLKREYISEIAEALSVSYLEPNKFDLDATVEKLGGDILIRDFWLEEGDVTGSLFVRDISDFSIYVPVHTTSERDRFTIAHELGHYFLHFLYPKSKGNNISELIANRYGTGRVEWEANWFAASFLMPQKMFQSIYEKYDGNIFSVASEFDVSISAALVRSQVLGLSGGKTEARQRKIKVDRGAQTAADRT